MLQNNGYKSGLRIKQIANNVKMKALLNVCLKVWCKIYVKTK